MAQRQSTGSSVVASTGGVAVGSINVAGNVEGDIIVANYYLENHTYHGAIIRQTVEQQASPRVKLRDVVPQPPRPPHGFVDRAVELDQLDRMIVASEAVAVCGPDGIGKTALLKRAACGDAARAKPGGVVVLEGIDEHGEALGADDVVQRLFDALYESEPRLKAEADAEAIRTYLSNTEPLVALDGLNLPLSALARIADLCPNGALLLTRTRPVPDDIARTMAIGPLPRTDALELLAARSGVLLDTGSRPILDALCDLLGDVPLALGLAGNIIREKRMSLHRAQAILAAVRAPASDEITAGVQRSFALVHAALTRDERRVLAVCAASPGVSVDLDWLHEALGVTVPVEAVVDQLKAIGLLQANSPRLRVDPGVRTLARLGANEVALKTHLIEYLRTAFQTRSLDWAFCTDELGNTLSVIEWAATQQRWADVIALGRAIDSYLMLHGLWDAWRMSLNRVLEAALQSESRADEAWARHQLGTHMAGAGQINQAVRQLRQALEIRHSLGDAAGAAFTQHNLDQLVPPTPPPGQPPPPPGQPQTTTPKPKRQRGCGCGITKAIVGGLLGMTLCSLLCATFLLSLSQPARAPAPPAAVIFIDTPTATQPPAPSDTPTPPPTETPTPTDTLTPSPTPTVDTTNPEFGELWAEPDPVYYGDSGCGDSYLTFSATVGDDSNVTWVEIGYCYDGGPCYQVEAVDVGGGVYEAAVDVDADSEAMNALDRQDGTVSWYVLAEDEAGNQSESLPLPVEIHYCDTTAPDFGQLSAEPDPVYYGDSGCGASHVTFSATVGDDSNVTWVEIGYCYDGGPCYQVEAVDVGGGVYEAAVDVDSEAMNALDRQDGTVSWYVLAEDEAGNQSENLPLPVEIHYCDTTAPDFGQLSAKPDPAYYGDSKCGDTTTTFDLQASDASGIKRVEIWYYYEGKGGSGSGGKRDAEYVGSDPLGNGRYRLPLNHNDGEQADAALNGRNGLIVWYPVVYDVHDNVATPAEQAAQIAKIAYCDAQAPEAPDIIGPTKGDALSCSSKVKLSWEAPDAPYGIVNYRVTLQSWNGTGWTPAFIWDPITDKIQDATGFTKCDASYRWQVIARDKRDYLGRPSDWAEFRILR